MYDPHVVMSSGYLVSHPYKAYLQSNTKYAYFKHRLCEIYTGLWIIWEQVQFSEFKALKCLLTKHIKYAPFPTNIDFFVCEIERRRENRKIIH